MTNTATVDLDELDRLLRHRTGHGLADLLEWLLDGEAPVVATAKDPAEVVALRPGDVYVTHDTDREIDLRTRRARGHYRRTASAPIAAEA